MPNTDKSYLKKLFVQELITSFGYLAPLSMLAIFLSEYKGISTQEVGLAMFLSSITARWGRLFFSPFFDLLKPYILLSIMQIIGAIGYVLLTFYQSFSVIIVAFIFIGLFYGSNTIVTRVLTSLLKNKSNSSTENFSIIHVGTNISATLGPIIINFIYIFFNKEFAFKFMGIFLCCAAIFTFITMKDVLITKQENLISTILKLLFSKKLWHIYFLILLSWFFCAQIYSLAPIIISHVLHLPAQIWTISTINGVAIILFSIKINRVIANITKNYYFQISISLVLSLIGFISIIFNYSVVNLYIGVIFLTLSEILFIPAFQALLAENAPEESRIAIFAIYAVFMGIGEGTGYYFGTKSLEIINSSYSWYKNSTYIILLLIFIGVFISVQKTISIKKSI
jgi:MFS family permease